MSFLPVGLGVTSSVTPACEGPLCKPLLPSSVALSVCTGPGIFQRFLGGSGLGSTYTLGKSPSLSWAPFPLPPPGPDGPQLSQPAPSPFNGGCRAGSLRHCGPPAPDPCPGTAQPRGGPADRQLLPAGRCYSSQARNVPRREVNTLPAAAAGSPSPAGI